MAITLDWIRNGRYVQSAILIDLARGGQTILLQEESEGNLISLIEAPECSSPSAMAVPALRRLFLKLSTHLNAPNQRSKSKLIITGG
jgi:hypothetical protein